MASQVNVGEFHILKLQNLCWKLNEVEDILSELCINKQYQWFDTQEFIYQHLYMVFLLYKHKHKHTPASVSKASKG